MTQISRGRRAGAAFGIVVAIGWLMGVFAADAVFSIGARPYGWLWLGLAYAAGLLLAAFLIGGRVLPVVALAVAVVLAAIGWYLPTPTHTELHELADEVQLPDDWEEVDSDELGSVWCLDGCPRVLRSYAAPGTFADQRRLLAESLKADGWKREGKNAKLRMHKGDRHLEVAEAEPGEDGRGRVTLRIG